MRYPITATALALLSLTVIAVAQNQMLAFEMASIQPDLRHFRATQWVVGGTDIRTVQGVLGHSSVTVTTRYAQYAPDHASNRVIEVRRGEAAKLAGEKQEDNAMFNVGQEGTCANSLDSLAL